ncbi:hypothetical protein CSUI_010503 [Cystoisospora suis]|uniref:Transmembrane protein n=1 Tax=Cystoisospora suis TaxID=483139 RepID=A0A2C6KDN9_9APIC|nr:hypothetical protein CSUI_010503 [Cystoisospora suis]
MEKSIITPGKSELRRQGRRADKSLSSLHMNSFYKRERKSLSSPASPFFSASFLKIQQILPPRSNCLFSFSCISSFFSLLRETVSFSSSLFLPYFLLFFSPFQVTLSLSLLLPRPAPSLGLGLFTYFFFFFFFHLFVIFLLKRTLKLAWIFLSFLSKHRSSVFLSVRKEERMGRFLICKEREF